jgi:hypothetical protein
MLTGRASNQGQEKSTRTKGDPSPGKLKWRVYSLSPGGGEKVFKEGNPCGGQCTVITGSPDVWKKYSLSLSVSSIKTFHFLFRNKILLNSHFSCFLILYLAEEKNLHL